MTIGLEVQRGFRKKKKRKMEQKKRENRRWKVHEKQRGKESFRAVCGKSPTRARDERKASWRAKLSPTKEMLKVKEKKKGIRSQGGYEKGEKHAKSQNNEGSKRASRKKILGRIMANKEKANGGGKKKERKQRFLEEGRTRRL